MYDLYKILALTVNFIILNFHVFAQIERTSPIIDSVFCKKNYSVFSALYNQKVFNNETLRAWSNVYKNCPDYSKNTYIYGANLYESFLKKESDTTNRLKYLDTLIGIYTKRIEVFGQEDIVNGMIGVALFKYNPDSYNNALHYLQKSLLLRKEKSNPDVIVSYFHISFTRYMNKEISSKSFLETYLYLTEIINENFKNEDDYKKNQYEQAFKIINSKINSKLIISCDTLSLFIEPLLKREPTDSYLFSSFAGIINKNCPDSEFATWFTETRLLTQNNSDDFNNYGDVMYNKKDYNKAKEYYLKALSIENDRKRKSDIYVKLSKLSKLEESVSYAKKALLNDSLNGDAYLQLANEYINGLDICFKDKDNSFFMKKAVYWLATDLCNKAKFVEPSLSPTADKFISIYSEFFPKQEEIFFNGYNTGDLITFNCWFTGTTKVRIK